MADNGTMNKNFLFIVPRFANINQYYSFPYGMAYVAANMKKNGFNVSCLNLCHHKESVKDLVSEVIKKQKIDAVCTGAMSVHWDQVDEVLTTVKLVDPDVITVVGGAIITSEIELALRNMQIDFGIVGEGEETMVELAGALCTNKDITKIKGIAFIDKDKKLTINEARPPIMDLDSLPFPDYEGLEFGKWLEIEEMYKGGITGLLYDLPNLQRPAEISASRSCPFKCTFCFHPLGNRYRQRSLDNVFSEISYLKEKYNINSVLILDELFSKDEERIVDFCSRIKKLGLKWSAQWRVGNINERILHILKESNVVIIGLGIESLSNSVLQSMKKGITFEEIEHDYSLCEKNGVHVGSNVILGDIAETEETWTKSINWLKEHPQYDINLRFVLAIPNSELWQYALSKGLIKNKLEFVKKKFPVINLTKEPDSIFFELVNKIDHDNFVEKYLISGKVISSKKTDTIYHDKDVYKFTVKCPICKNESEYQYFKFSEMPFSIIWCKHCYKRLKISTSDAFSESYLRRLYSYAYLYLGSFYWFYLRRYKIFRIVVKQIRKS